MCQCIISYEAERKTNPKQTNKKRKSPTESDNKTKKLLLGFVFYNKYEIYYFLFISKSHIQKKK